MNKRHHAVFSPALDLHGDVLIYGHWGRPLIAFPSQQGNVGDWESNGMIGAIEGLIEAGRVKVYCVASYDSGSWFSGAELEEAARRHSRYEDWLVNQVAPFIHEDCGGAQEILLAGASFGAYHAANLTLRRADLFPVGMCMSGVYDVTVTGGGERGTETYFHNPMDYVEHLHGDHLDWLRSHANLVLVCGQGMWEDTTEALESTKRFAGVLAGKGIRHELDLWGHDVPHDWPSWQRQVAHHLPRFV
jgi:esterase/lipase superfamily enzyme